MSSKIMSFNIIRKIGCILLVVGLVVAENCGAMFVETKNRQFVKDGHPFLFNGFNSYWMMTNAVEPSNRYKISQVFRDASQGAGLSVCRTWAFNDGGDYHALQKSPGVYDETVFEALDFVVSEAKKYGVYLILTLVNNYQDYGGKPQYVKWAQESGAKISNVDDFYTNELVKGYYKNHVKKVLTRVNTITGIAYKDEPTIMAWELMNEPRCEADPSGNTINRWVQEMAPYVKSLDNKHLLSVGMEGYYGDSVVERKQYNPNNYQVGTDFIANHLVKEIDFATIHAYPVSWLPGSNETTQMSFIKTWLTIHWKDSVRTLRKPLIFSEFGRSKKDAGYSTSVRDSFMNVVYSEMYKLARKGGVIGGGLVWQIMAQNMESYYDGLEIVLSEEPSTREVMARQSARMRHLQRSFNKRPRP